MRDILLRAVPALLLALPLTACGHDPDPGPGPGREGEPLGDGIAWTDGSTIHFPGGEEVDSGIDVGSAWRTSHGVVRTSWDGGSVYVTPDGTVTDLDIPDDVGIATDRTQSLVAWIATDPGDGVLHLLDPATGKERAAIKTDYDDAMSVSLDDDKVWLFGNELATTLEIDWPTGKVTKSPLQYVRNIDSRYATVEGGNENYVEAGAAKPGVIDLKTRKLTLRGWDWDISPRDTYATTMLSDGDASTDDTRIGVRDLTTGKYVARFPAKPDDSGDLDWTWTADEKTVSWFEADVLVQCAIATSTCEREKVDAKRPSIL